MCAKEGTISIATEEKEKKKKTDKREVIVKVKDTSSSKQLIKTKRNQRSLKSSSREYRLKIIRKMTTATDILKFQDQSQDKEKKEGEEENGKVVITWNPIKEIKRYRRTGDPIRHIDLNSILNFIVRKVAVKYPDIMTKYLCGENGSIIKKAFQRKEQEIELRKALTSGYLIQLQYSIESFLFRFHNVKYDNVNEFAGLRCNDEFNDY